MASAIWGVNFGVSRLGMDTFDPQLFVFMRFVLAVPFLFLILKWKEGSIAVSLKDAVILLLLGLVGVTLLEMIVMYSIQHTTLANASLLNVAPWPIFVALFSPFFIKERITSRTIVGGAMALIGVVMVILGGNEVLHLSQDHLMGSLAALLVSIIGALMNLSLMGLMKKYSPLRVTSWMILFGVLFLFPFTWGSWGKVSWETLGAIDGYMIGYNVVFCTIIAYNLWNVGMHHVGATTSNFFRYVVPVAAVIAGYVMFDEKLALWQMIGAVCMFLGLIWITLEKKSVASPS
jgi:drug/metabolite transporter (DMT)-like permease